MVYKQKTKINTEFYNLKILNFHNSGYIYIFLETYNTGFLFLERYLIIRTYIIYKEKQFPVTISYWKLQKVKEISGKKKKREGNKNKNQKKIPSRISEKELEKIISKKIFKCCKYKKI